MNYKVFLTTKINTKTLAKGSGIIVIEADDYSSTEIKAIKSKGYKVLAYLSVGTIEEERPWWKTYKKYALKKLEDWPDECYADLTRSEWRTFLTNRASTLKKKGFDGWWLDNIDVYEYYPTAKMKAATKVVLKEIKSIGGYVMINGGSRFLKAVDTSGIIDGYTQEEVFSRITSYKGKGTFGKQKADEKAYYKTVIAETMKKGIQCFLLEYTRDESVKESIKAYYTAKKCTGYYISGNVDL